MRQPLDNFSRQSDFYRKFRPQYPMGLYDHILPLVKDRSRCWECGTGNGQVAIHLASFFEQVEATDISSAQLELAERRENIRYSLQRAEATNFPDEHFDLVTVAQAAHWFDINSFNKEVKRVGKPEGILAIWGYDLPRINDRVDELLDVFYNEIIGAYWNDERRHIEDHYESLALDLGLLPIGHDLAIVAQWYPEDLVGYLCSWSSVQNYMKTRDGRNPVDWIIGKLADVWDHHKLQEVRFPLFLRLGRIEKGY